MGYRNLFVLVLMSYVLLVAGTAQATHTTFDYQVERFQVVGNLPNGLADDFDDGILTATVPLGTVTESDGALHIQSPGIHDTLPGVPMLLLDRSDAIMDLGFVIVNGAGNFSTTATLRNQTFQEGGYFATNLAYNNDSMTVEILSLSVFNANTAMVDAFDALNPAYGFSATGLNLSMTRSIFGLAGSNLPIQLLDHQTINLPTAALTGDVLFVFDFDDTNDLMTGFISLDSGTSVTAFTEISPTGLGPSDFGVWTLFGDPITVVPEPSTAVLVGLGLAGIAILGKRQNRLM